jgi:acyl carrier protein
MPAEEPGIDEVRSLLSEFLAVIGRVPLGLAKDGATIDGDLEMESVAFLEVQVAIEDTLGVEIDPVRVVELNEFSAIADYIHSLARSR